MTKEGFLIFSCIKNVLEYRTLMYVLSNVQEDGSCSLRQNDIAKALNTHRQAVNRSVSLLEEKNIFSVEKKGNKRIYHANPEYCITSIGYIKLKQNYDNFKNSGGKNLSGQ